MPEDMQVGDAASRSRAVAADLSEIFASSQPSAAVSGDSAVRRLAPRAGSRFKPATIGALLAAGLVGVSAGVLLAGKGAKSSETALEPAIAAVVAPIPAPVRAPIPQPVAPVIQASAVEPAPTVEKAVEVKAKAKPKAKPQKAKPQKAEARPVRASRAEVLAADRRLRRAYDRAIRAGVPRPVLVDYRNRWNRLRRTTWDEPAQLVRGYDRLERGLSAEAKRFS